MTEKTAVTDDAAQCHAVLEAVSDAALIVDHDGRVVDGNLAAQRLFGRARGDLRDLPLNRLLDWSASGEFADIAGAIGAGNVAKARGRLVSRDGAMFDAVAHGVPFGHPARRRALVVIRGANGESADVQRLEQRVNEQARELATLSAISQTITSTLELQPLLELILDQLRSMVEYQVAGLSVLEDGDLVTIAERGGANVEIGARTPLSEHANTREMLRLGQPCIVPDLGADTPLARRVRANIDLLPADQKLDYADIASWMSAPLIARDARVGVLTLAHAHTGYYTPERARLVLAFANQAAIAIENARLFAVEQRRAEQFRIISELSYRIISILDVDELVTQTVHLIRETFGFYHVHIGLIEGGQVTFQSHAGVWRDGSACGNCGLHPLRVGLDGVCGRVAGSGQPILVPDVTREPSFIPLVPGQTGSELALPLQVQGRVIGVLDVESDRVNAFSSTDVAMLQSFANQTAVALENARLYRQAQQLAALEERQRLARELHDSVSQALYGIALGARTARAQLERDVANVAEPLDYVLSLADAGLAEMRALIFELRPESLLSEGLVAALTRLTDSLRERHRLAVQTRFEGEPDISLEAKEALYRVAQEALRNIAKHAQARLVTIQLTTTTTRVGLAITDNGVGFDPDRDYPGHLGLRSMRERMEKINGILVVESSIGQGARVVASVPPAHHRLPVREAN